MINWHWQKFYGSWRKKEAHFLYQNFQLDGTSVKKLRLKIKTKKYHENILIVWYHENSPFQRSKQWQFMPLYVCMFHSYLFFSNSASFLFFLNSLFYSIVPYSLRFGFLVVFFLCCLIFRRFGKKFVYENLSIFVCIYTPWYSCVCECGKYWKRETVHTQSSQKNGAQPLHVFQGIVLKMQWYVCMNAHIHVFVRCYVSSTSCAY